MFNEIRLKSNTGRLKTKQISLLSPFWPVNFLRNRYPNRSCSKDSIIPGLINASGYAQRIELFLIAFEVCMKGFASTRLIPHLQASKNPHPLNRMRVLKNTFWGMSENYIIPPIPPPIPPPIGGIAGLSSFSSTNTHSVVRNMPAIEAAFSSAMRVTLAGSITPAS